MRSQRWPFPRARGRAAFVAVLVTLAGACTRGSVDVRPAASQPSSQPSDGSTLTPAPSPTGPAHITKAEAARAKANELGQIPVLMYHRILPHPESDYDRSPSAFLADLRRLYREGYRPIRAVDLVRGEIDVPLGKSPVVLTFDDASREQFSYTSGKKVDPHSAVGLLLDFSAHHPGFRPVATMYVNQFPFGTSRGPEILRDLYRRGFELGNHTLTHADLSSLSAKGVRRELALGKKVITSAVPRAEVATMALPLGVWPKPHKLAYQGVWHRIQYRHQGVFLVGAGPSPSPYSRSFEPLAIPRIKPLAQTGKTPNYGLEFWLDYLKDHSGERYISDGDPTVISYPKRLRKGSSKRNRARSNPY